MAFGQRLRHVVKFYRYTQDEFAQIIGTSKANLFNYFADKTKPNIEVIAKLKKKHANLNLEWLITGKGDMLLKRSSNPDDDFLPPDTAEEPSGKYGCKELLEEKDKRIKTLEEMVQIQKETIKRFEKEEG
jgi:transcriptional regulator with XRE-family HTH domain